MLIMCSPTTSPYGYSSFPKEESGDSITFLMVGCLSPFHIPENVFSILVHT